MNKRALTDIQSWFCALFPRARREEGTDCWRVSSEDLGRGLQEDISVHPAEGGRDFGTEESCSPIDLVIAWGGAPDAVAAANYLCEKLRVDPKAMGWKPRRSKVAAPDAKERPSQRGIDWGEPVDFLADESLGTPDLQPRHIPGALWPFVSDTATRMGVDPACVALAAVVSCASVMSDEWQVQPKRNDYTWTEQPRVWAPS